MQTACFQAKKSFTALPVGAVRLHFVATSNEPFRLGETFVINSQAFGLGYWNDPFRIEFLNLMPRGGVSLAPGFGMQRLRRKKDKRSDSIPNLVVHP